MGRNGRKSMLHISRRVDFALTPPLAYNPFLSNS